MPRAVRAVTATALSVTLLTSLLHSTAHAHEETGPPTEEGAVSTAQLFEQAAIVQAQESGEPVEIAGATTETTRHLANPDGSFTTEQNAHPVRVREGNGWTPVDTDLVIDSQGEVRPKAVVADIVFSGGGDRALASIGLGSNSVELGWHEDLPTPVLEGDQATYPDVLPDVDLVLTAGVDGFGQVLVVHTPEAAQHEKLADLELGLATEGVTMRLGEHGNLDAIGDKGQESVFSAIAPAMWDSSGEEEALEDATVMAPTGARTALLDVDLTPDSIRLVPDTGMLTDTATQYPVYIDPLAGVYDHTNGQLILYVNGFEESRVAVDHAWHADDSFLIGGAQQRGSSAYFWTGDLDDAHTYQGVLNERELSQVYAGQIPVPQL